MPGLLVAPDTWAGAVPTLEERPRGRQLADGGAQGGSEAAHGEPGCRPDAATEGVPDGAEGDAIAVAVR